MKDMDTELTAHPAAELFPIVEETIEDLKRDIKIRGLIDPIVKYQDQILDGRHRYKACLELGIEPKFVEYPGDDPIGFVVSKNLHRRHLNLSQQAIVAADVKRLRAAAHARGEAQQATTHAELAKEFGVSARQIEKASALRNAVDQRLANPKLVDAVRRGEGSLHWASQVSRRPIAEQDRFLGDGWTMPALRRNRRSCLNERDQLKLGLDRWFDRLFESVRNAKKEGKLSARRSELTAICDRVQLHLNNARQQISKPADGDLAFEDAESARLRDA